MYIILSHNILICKFENEFPLQMAEVKVFFLVNCVVIISTPIVREQDAWTREQVKLNKNDPLWQQAGLVAAQMDGLQAGAADWAKSQQREVLQLYALISSLLSVIWIIALS